MLAGVTHTGHELEIQPFCKVDSLALAGRSWWIFWADSAPAGTVRKAADWHWGEHNSINSSFSPPSPLKTHSSWSVPSLHRTRACFQLLKKITQLQLGRHHTNIQSSHRILKKTWGDTTSLGMLLTSAWCSSFCCRTSITNSARRIVSSNFLAGVTNRPTFSVVQELKLKGRQGEKLDEQ